MVSLCLRVRGGVGNEVRGGGPAGNGFVVRKGC